MRERVRIRAGHRCEYCRLRQAVESGVPFHTEHIVAQQHGGVDAEDNLAFACCWCNAVKGPNLTSLDPDSGKITRLFHPRQDRWEEHFRREGPHILGVKDVGRTTVFLLRFNSEMNLRLRSLLLELGEPLD